MFLLDFVCLCVCVCVQDDSKSYGWIFLKFWGYVGHGTNYQWFNFGGDLKGILDSGSLWNFRYHCVKGGIREPLAKWIWWRHLANNIALAEVPAGCDCFLVVNAFTYCVDDVAQLHGSAVSLTNLHVTMDSVFRLAGNVTWRLIVRMDQTSSLNSAVRASLLHKKVKNELIKRHKTKHV